MKYRVESYWPEGNRFRMWLVVPPEGKRMMFHHHCDALAYAVMTPEQREAWDRSWEGDGYS
jgi:hypothetical protein